MPARTVCIHGVTPKRLCKECTRARGRKHEATRDRTEYNKLLWQKRKNDASWKAYMDSYRKDGSARAKELRTKAYAEKLHDRVVYFVEAVGADRIKIGSTTNIEHRLSTLKVGSPFPLRLLAIRRDDGTLEAQLHRQFASNRLHGEWFRMTEDLLKLAVP